jgi:molybdopterin converting factor small subunit
MAVVFLIPGALRPFAEGNSEVRIDQFPATLAGALQILCTRYPPLRHRLLTEQGQIREHINLFVGKEHIRYSGGLETPLADGAEVSILPAISGGSR